MIARHTALVYLLVVAWAVRIALVIAGGQRFWPDEDRYFRALNFLRRLGEGGFNNGLDYLFENQEHIAFVALATIPGVFQFVIRTLLGLTAYDTLRVPALVLSMASVAIIGLTYALALKTTSNRHAALAAAVLSACASSLFYWSRHLIPYDLALMLALLALWVGLDDKTSRPRSFACGLLAGLAFVTYSGYWATVFVVAVTHTFTGSLSWRQLLLRGGMFSVGALSWPILLTVVTTARHYTPYIQALSSLATSVNWGDYAEGWTVAWEYLLHTEQGWFIVWLVGLALTTWKALGRSRPHAIWLSATLLLYLSLAVTSAVMHKFVLHARLARQLAPFLILTAACSFTEFPRLAAFLRPWQMALIAILLAGQTVITFAPAFKWRLPAEFTRDAEQVYGTVNHASTIQTIVSDDFKSDANPRYVLLNAAMPAPVLGLQTAPRGKVILEAMHPLQFEPFLYEFYTADERRLMRMADYSLQLIDTQSAP